MKKTKKALLYSPYLDILGGGELHILSIAKIFCEHEMKVDVLWDDPEILNKLKKQFDINFKNLSIIPNFLIQDSQLMKYERTGHYDFLIYVTDGSYFFSKATNNYVFAMYPQKDLYNKNILNFLKLRNFSFIANSGFTAQFIQSWTGKPVEVLYPYIREELFIKDYKKEDIILSVGRFFKHLHSKRQDILIESFKKLKQKNKLFKKYELYLIGGLKREDEAYLDELKKFAGINSDIHFITNADSDDIKSFYRRARYYWHGAGFGIDEMKTPQFVEHLGIAPLEAMASKCLSFCHESGGAKEIIKDGENGFLYKSIDELIRKTVEVENSNNQKIIAERGQQFVASNFSLDQFRKHVIRYFNL